MRINKFVALASGLSRRAADVAIQNERVRVNGQQPSLGQGVAEDDIVLLDGRPLVAPSTARTTILLNKPAGYVVSRNGQGSHTIYNLLPAEYHALKPVGRLDKDSSGLLVLTDNGQLAHELTHPSKRKVKVYNVALNKPLQPLHQQMISDYGIALEDGSSKLQLNRVREGDNTRWHVTMREGRNRQIRRTFSSLGYTVTYLHRTHFGAYALHDTAPGKYIAADLLHGNNT